MSQSFDLQNSNPAPNHINEERISEVYQLLEQTYGDGSTSYLFQLLNDLVGDRNSEVKLGNSNLQAELLKALLKAGLDSTSETIEIVEDKAGSNIYFLGDDKAVIASISTNAPALLVLRQALHHHSWEINSDGYSSIPIYYYKFSDSIKGAVSFSPPLQLEDGSIKTSISILKTPSIHYIANYIIVDK